MQLAILMAVICALAQSDAAGAAPVAGGLWRAMLTLAGVLVAPLAAALGSLPILRGLARESALPPAECERIWSRVESLVLGLWLTVVAATMYLLQWPRVVRSNWSLGQWPLIDEVLILLPVVAPLVLLWAVMHRLQWTASRTLAQAEGRRAPPPRLLAYLWQNARQHLGLIVLPALVVIAIQESVVWIWPAAEASGLWWLHLPLLATMLVLMPLVLTRVWRTASLPAGDLRDRLTDLCSERRVGVRDVLVWHTEGCVANAAVTGMVPGLRYVLLSDGLLARLSPGEVEAVVRHELGHIAARHMLLRMLLLALPLALGVAWQELFPGATEAYTRVLTSLGLPESLQLALLLPAGLAAYAVLVVGRYCQWLEHEADLATCIDQRGAVDRAAAECFARALIKIVGRGRESRWARWLHPPVGQRLAVLALAIADPATAVRFRRRLAACAWGIVAAYAVIAGMLLA
jgi:STE24 endopeptidase